MPLDYPRERGTIIILIIQTIVHDVFTHDVALMAGEVSSSYWRIALDPPQCPLERVLEPLDYPRERGTIIHSDYPNDCSRCVLSLRARCGADGRRGELVLLADRVGPPQCPLERVLEPGWSPILPLCYPNSHQIVDNKTWTNRHI